MTPAARPPPATCRGNEQLSFGPPVRGTLYSSPGLVSLTYSKYQHAFLTLSNPPVWARCGKSRPLLAEARQGSGGTPCKGRGSRGGRSVTTHLRKGTEPSPGQRVPNSRITPDTPTPTSPHPTLSCVIGPRIFHPVRPAWKPGSAQHAHLPPAEPNQGFGARSEPPSPRARVLNQQACGRKASYFPPD